ncbi:flagellar hook protein FlgE [Fluviispira multicolorata]|uniref:Flagellar hook protein FlgE n=1 Tax=Fluviispira multicolorata TaxID=2654512 RepID=A0A833N3M1_9BACT|nr:flagellar hook protein FlgE [Fluviispira multicolorata]KAB8029984.1 flagellar hook-basal body complex protein [Fluviispira multicolorata]
MPINYALFSAVSGLGSNADGMSVVANNIANANTKSFKTDRAEFEDMFAVTLNERSQLGRGSRLRNITTLFNQGALTNTGQITDLSVQGEGFFIIKNEMAEVKESNGMFFTRQGSFRFDRDGKLTDPTGSRVQGFMPDPDSNNRLSVKMSDLQIISNVLPPRATSIVNVVANLDVRDRTPLDEFDLSRPLDTSNFASAVTIFDNFGYGRQAVIYYVKSPDQDKNAWDWYATVDGQEVSTDPQRNDRGKVLPAVIANGRVEFDEDGKPILPFLTKAGIPVGIDIVSKTDAFDVQFVNGARPQKLQFNFGPTIEEDYVLGAQGSTSIAARSGISFHSQDGYEAGYLKTIKIDLDGMIRGTYTNGLERRLGAMALATFPNNHGLQKVGRNNWITTPKAGEARIGLPQTSSRGSIYSASLEESNVDLAQQFVDMILTQRGFQANSKAITTTDTMLEEIINLKR